MTQIKVKTATELETQKYIRNEITNAQADFDAHLRLNTGMVHARHSDLMAAFNMYFEYYGKQHKSYEKYRNVISDASRLAN